MRSWRIIGYENRVTPDETFTQDRKEFAELPSGAATTVFYELELHPWARTLAGTTTLGSVEVRWVAPDTGQSWRQWDQLTGAPRTTFNTVGDPYLQLGAVVALASDRYSALSDGAGESGGLRADLADLNAYLHGLSGRLGGSQAYQDFALPPGPPRRVRAQRVRLQPLAPRSGGGRPGGGRDAAPLLVCALPTTILA